MWLTESHTQRGTQPVIQTSYPFTHNWSVRHQHSVHPFNKYKPPFIITYAQKLQNNYLMDHYINCRFQGQHSTFLRKLEDKSLIWLSTVPLVLDKLRLLMKIMQYDWKLQNSYYSGLTLRWGRQNQHSLSKLVIKTTTKAFISACSYKLLLNQLLYMCHPSHYIKVKQHVKIKPFLPIKQKKTPNAASYSLCLLILFSAA